MARTVVLLLVLNVIGLVGLSSITIPYVESFDSVTPPDLPPGWNAVLTGSGYGVAETNPNSSHSNPNHLNLYDGPSLGTAIAVMPATELGLPIHLSSISFWAKSYPADVNFCVGSMDLDADAGSFQLIQQFTLNSYWQLYTCNLAQIAAGRRRIAFKLADEDMGYHADIDDLDLHYSLSHDIELCNLTANSPFNPQQNAQFNVSIVNQGYSPIDSYSIALLDASNTVLTIVAGDTIAAGESRQMTINWSLAGPGNQVYKAKVICPQDLNSDNDITEPIVVEVLPPGVEVYDNANNPVYQNKYPIDLYWKTSLCETLYLSTELPEEDRLIWGLSYSATILTPTIGIKPIMVWMGHTNAQDLTRGWIPANELEQVFAGQVSFAPGEHLVNIAFSQPFLYEAGNNLAIMVLRPLDSQYYSSNDDFYCDTTDIPRSLMLKSDTEVYDPNDPQLVGTSTIKPVTYFLVTEASSGSDDPVVPALSTLQAYPNPFNPSTTIAFSMASPGSAQVKIYNLKGQLLRTLWDGDLSSGEHSFVWDATDDGGRALASGLYLCRLDCGGRMITRKLVLMK